MRTSTTKWAVTAATSSAHAAPVRVGQSAHTPISTPTTARLTAASRASLHRSSGRRACSRATAKCSLETTMAVVAAPSRNRWIAGQRATGSDCWELAASSARPAHATTATWARR
ncbi:hypothetical protein ABT173_28010 [Streptomyces sp. NPDC001795]|uniref:hypothetical protein n=1 Tax=Streptomyces sp. NPDC001795 TaxID=3154525 RepID=UPI00331F2EA6